MHRCFVAFELDPMAREALARALRPLERAARADQPRFLPPAALHVTLKFLGPVEHRRLPALVQALRDAVSHFPPQSSSCAGFGGLPRRAKAHVLVAVLSDELGLMRLLQQGVEQASSALGFSADSRPFKPHATLARFRTAVDVRRYLPLLVVPRQPVTLANVGLYESTLEPGGARYTQLERIPLAGSAP